MNWDWDKLQEKRKQQNTWDFGKKINNTPEPEEDFGFDAETEKKNFEEFFKKNTPNNNDNGNNGDNGNNNGNNHSRKQPNEFLKKAQLPGIKWVFILFVLVWLASGIFIVKPDEAGVILRFGAYTRTESAGLHYHLPYPIETVILPNVSRVRQAEVGFRSAQNADIFQQGRTQAIDDEGSMLTGDENIVNIQFNIQYNIKPDGAFDYLFNVTQPDAVVKKAAEAAMREVIGRTTLDSALTGGRVEIQNNVTELLQSILDRYQVGVQVVAVQMQDVQPPKDVQEAFKDVASAREDKQRLINIAEAYRQDILPKAQGTAAEIVNKAEAYKQTRIAHAEGETARFLAVLAEYEKAQDITKKRLLYESLEKMLSNPEMEKMVLPNEGTNQIMPLIPMGNGAPSSLEKALPNSLEEDPLSGNISQNSSQQTANSARPNARGTR